MSAEVANPYVGLRPFESGDSFQFFGRREQTAELLELLHRTHFLAVVGSSGCGKSSLIRAGLIPALMGGFLVEERDRWRIAAIRPGDAPLRNLAGALATAVGGPAQDAQADTAELLCAITESHAQGVIDFLASRLDGGTNLLLLVDQFEEVFAYRGWQDDSRLAEVSTAQRRDLAIRRAVADDFVDLMIRLGERIAFPLYTVLTLRTDFLGECDLFYGLPEALNRSRYLVPRLDRGQLRQAIEGPALLGGTRLAPRLLDLLLNDLGDRADRLPVLQHALQRTWEAWRVDGGGAIDLEHYRAAGTLEDALSRHAEEALCEEDIAATARIFQRLTDTEAGFRRVRRPASLSELMAVSGLDRSGVESIVERFRAGGRYFLVLSAGASPEDPRIDLSHESLIRQWPRLRRWVDEERHSRDKLIELVRGARREAAGRAALLRNPELRIALDWRAAAAPTAAWVERYSWREDDFAVAMSYLDRSAEAARAEARRRSRARALLITAAATVLLALSALTVWALRSRGEARSQEAAAHQTTEFLVSLFKVSDPGEERGSTITARELLDQGAERIGRELADQPEAKARLMNTIGVVYRELGLYDKAETFLKGALQSRESRLGPDHLDVAESLSDLSTVYWRQGRYEEAVPFSQRALKIQEKTLGPDHPDVATSLNNLGNLYNHQGRYAEAEPFYRRALVIREKALGPDHLDVAKGLNNLANLYRAQGRLAEAEPLFRRSLAIREKVLSPDHPLMAVGLENLAAFYQSEQRYAAAEPFYRRALAIREKALGPDHPLVALTLGNFARLYQQQGRLTEAEPLFQRSLAIREKALGPDHPEVAWTLHKLANLYQKEGRRAEAESFFRRSLAIREKALGPGNPDVAESLEDLAYLCQEQGRLAEAEPLYRQALAIREKALGGDHPQTADVLENLAGLLRLLHRDAEAAELEARARSIRAHHSAGTKPGS